MFTELFTEYKNDTTVEIKQDQGDKQDQVIKNLTAKELVQIDNVQPSCIPNAISKRISTIPNNREEITEFIEYTSTVQELTRPTSRQTRSKDIPLDVLDNCTNFTFTTFASVINPIIAPVGLKIEAITDSRHITISYSLSIKI